MKTRVGKIARLPHHLREQLNHRLFNGAMGPELAKWLNALPEVREVLAEFFAGSPINRQNLTEWRQGGYEEWLRHQEHERRLQRVVEEGESLGKYDTDSDDDLFEHSSRIALAELMADFDSLHELKGEERSNRLRNLTRELTRLQYAYNHSRWTALAYSKWNDRFLGPEDYKDQEEDIPDSKIQTPSDRRPEPAPCNAAVPFSGTGLLAREIRTGKLPVPLPPIHEEEALTVREDACFQNKLPSAASPSCVRQSVTIAAAPQLETRNSKPETLVETPEFKPDQTTSNEGEADNNHPPPLAPRPQISPVRNPILDPLADFRRQAARLKTLREPHHEI